jgi:hypothetical protein
MRAKPHPEQGFRPCLDILRLEKTRAQCLEAACRRGTTIGADPIQHGNIHGRGYYH